MDFLQVQKEPLSLDQLYQIKVTKKDKRSEDNNEVIMDMFRVLGLTLHLPPNDSTPRSLEIGFAQKIGKTLILKQEEAYSVVMNDVPNQIDNNNNTKSLKRMIPKKNGPIIKKKVQDSFTNGLAALGNMDDITGPLQSYSHYFHTPSQHDEKVPLYGSFFTHDKIKFLNDIRKKLMSYLEERGKEDQSNPESCDITDKTSGFHPLIHQDIVKTYLNATTPYRGLLLFHGLGSGKTCTSIGIIEALKNNKPRVYIMCPASLIKNYKTQLKFCGNDIFRRDEYWRFVKYPQDDTLESFLGQVRTLTGLPMSYLKKQKGVYLKHLTEKNDQIDDKELDDQIDAMIDAKFKFISYNGITDAKWNQMCRNQNPFDHATVVIDEGHNFVSRVLNKRNIGKTSVSTKIYQKLIEAENCNVVVLSGTPLINYPSELGVMFNMIHGSNAIIEIHCSHSKSMMIQMKALKTAIQGIVPLVDFVDFQRDRVSSKRGVLKIFKNPYGFVKRGQSIERDMENASVTNEVLKDNIIERLIQQQYSIDQKKTEIKYMKPFPDTEKEFNAVFLNKESESTSDLYFKKKILGLVSYIGDKKSLMPKIVVPTSEELPKKKHYEEEQMFIQEVKMNMRVLQGYAAARTMEQEQEKRQKQTKQASDESEKMDKQTSSYKIFSRAACNFVFPSSLPRPYLGGKDRNQNPKLKMNEDDLEVMDVNEKLEMSDGKYDTSDVAGVLDGKLKRAKDEYKREIEHVLAEFQKTPHQYFESKMDMLYKHPIFTSLGKTLDTDRSHTENNQLELYSPKFLKILQNLMNEDHIGSHLLYSQFRTLEGIGIFKIVLDYYGYTEFKLRKVNAASSIVYKLDIRNPYYKNKSFEDNPSDNPEDDFKSLKGRKFYALYTGKEDTEEKEIIRNIYNGQLDKVPPSLRTEIIQYFYEGDEANLQKAPNAYGELIQLLMITSSGAEGIDLKNVRYVHIMEPYWHPVRVNQVIGRARRICSHADLPPEEQTVQVFFYLLVHDQELLKSREIDDAYRQLIEGDTDTRNGGNYVPTTDETLYTISHKKALMVERFHKALMETSIDCMLNYEDKGKCFTLPSTRSKSERLVQVDRKDDRTTMVSSTRGKRKQIETIENNENGGI